MDFILQRDQKELKCEKNVFFIPLRMSYGWFYAVKNEGQCFTKELMKSSFNQEIGIKFHQFSGVFINNITLVNFLNQFSVERLNQDSGFFSKPVL